MPLSGAQPEGRREFTNEELNIARNLATALIENARSPMQLLREAYRFAIREHITREHIHIIFSMVINGVRARIEKANGRHNGKSNGNGVAH